MNLPTTKEIIAPPQGWAPQTLYLVEVSFNRANPIHRSYLRVGFLQKDGTPGSYTELWNGSYEQTYGLREVYYLRPIQVLHHESA